MPRYDLVCSKCGEEFLDQFFVSAEVRDRWINHLIHDEVCDGRMIVKSSAPNFMIKGYSAKNGYSK